MPKRELLHEWMHRFHLKHSVVRVWTMPTKKTEVFYGALRDEYMIQKAAIKAVVDTNPKARPLDEAPQALVEQIAALPCVAAVEHLDESGNGRLVYVDWP